MIIYLNIKTCFKQTKNITVNLRLRNSCHHSHHITGLFSWEPQVTLGNHIHANFMTFILNLITIVIKIVALFI